VKRQEFVAYLRRHGCETTREGARHTVVANESNGQKTVVPRHQELPNLLCRGICRQLGIPHPWE